MRQQPGRTWTFIISILSATISVSAINARAFAGLVEPGGSIFFPNPDINPGVTPFVPPTGDLLATDSRQLTLVYAVPAGFTLPPGTSDYTTHLQYTSEVLRDPASGDLTFYNALEEVGNETFGSEGAKAQYASFATFTTDVTGDSKAVGLNVTRSNDGATFTADGGKDGQGKPPRFAVATNARGFNRGGSLTVTLTDEYLFSSIDPGSGDFALATATASFDNIFQPAGATPPTGIPLPPAAWTGLITLAAIAVIPRVRRCM